jgi:hypothetical protein
MVVGLCHYGTQAQWPFQTVQYMPYRPLLTPSLLVWEVTKIDKMGLKKLGNYFSIFCFARFAAAMCHQYLVAKCGV